jgi:hypothetical protein
MLHRNYTDMWIWVDQLSINQDDNEEESSQIYLMGEIFASAHRVAIWLGRQSDTSDLAMERLNQIYAVANIRYSPLDEIMSASEESQEDFMIDCLTPRTHKDYLALKSLNHLFRRSWFSRLWVLREASALEVENVTIFCGSAQTPYWASRLVMILMFSWNNASTTKRLLQPLSANQILKLAYLHCFLPFEPQAIMHLLLTTTYFEATDPRDKYFCLIPHASDVARQDDVFTVDYTRSQTEVATSFVMWYLKTHRNLDFLGISHHGRDPGVSILPCWIPNFFHSTAGMYLSGGMLKDYTRAITMRASGCLDQIPAFSLPSSLRIPLLEVSAVRVGVVTNHFPPQALIMREHLEFLQKTSCRLNSKSMKMVWLLAASGESSQEDPYSSFGTVDEMAKPPSDPRSAESALFKTYPPLEGRRFFYTNAAAAADSSEQLAGLGPRGVHTSYEVWMFKGGKALYMVSPKRVSGVEEIQVLNVAGGESGKKQFHAGDKVYRFVGECFMPGLMQGQLVDIMKQNVDERPSPLRHLESDFRTICLS